MTQRWETRRLRDAVTKLVDGSHNPPKKQDSGYPMLSARNVEQGRIVFEGYRFISEDAFAVENLRTRIEPGDVLLTIVGTIGRSAVVPHGLEPFALQRSVAALSPKADLLPKFLNYQLQSPRIQQHFEANARGTAQKGVYLKTLGETPVLIPSVDEQGEVVAEIEKQFSRLDEAVAGLKRVKANIKRYRASVLDTFFADDPNVCLGDVIESGPQNGLYLPKSAYGAGTPMLRIDDYQTNWMRPAGELRRVTATDAQVATWALREGDLVVNRVNSMSHLGKCASIPASLAGAVFESNMMRLRLNAHALPRYVELCLGGSRGRGRLTQRAKWAVNQASINQQDLLATPLPLPNIDRQREIVAEVDRLLSIAREAEAEVEANLKRAQSLRQAILSKSFQTDTD